MRIIFIGTVMFSQKALEKLIALKKDVVGVVTKQKSEFNSDFADLSTICKKNGIEYTFCDSVNSRESIGFIKKNKPDVIFCFGWSELIKKELLDIPPSGVLGYHPALLPQNRGRHPLIWVLVLGLKETGSTFFFMDEGADSGDIISQRRIKIDYTDTAASLYEKVSQEALLQIEEFVPLLEKGNYKRVKQDESYATYWRKRTAKDGQIDWRMSSYAIYNLVRALTKPYCGAHFIYKNKGIKLWRAEEVKDYKFTNIESGKVIEVYPTGKFLIKAGDNCIIVKEILPQITVKKGEYL